MTKVKNTAMSHDVAAPAAVVVKPTLIETVKAVAEKVKKSARFTWNKEVTSLLMLEWTDSKENQEADNVASIAKTLSELSEHTISPAQVRAKLVNLKMWKKAAKKPSLLQRVKREEAWTEEKTKLCIDLYEASNKDSSNENLAAIGKKVTDKSFKDGKEILTPKSMQMIRNKLVKEGIYVNQDRAVGGTNSEKKLSITRAIEELLNFGRDTLISLEKGKKSELASLRDKLKTLAFYTIESPEDCKRKADMIDAINASLGVNVQSLSRVPKAELQKLFDAII